MNEVECYCCLYGDELAAITYAREGLMVKFSEKLISLMPYIPMPKSFFPKGVFMEETNIDKWLDENFGAVTIQLSCNSCHSTFPDDGRDAGKETPCPNCEGAYDGVLRVCQSWSSKHQLSLPVFRSRLKKLIMEGKVTIAL
jgi:hypothetical protein